MNRQLRSFLFGALFAAIILWLFFSFCSPEPAESRRPAVGPPPAQTQELEPCRR